MNLYEYTDMHQKALVELQDMDLPAEVVEDTLNAMVGEIEEKTKSVVAYMRNLGADVKAMKNAEQEIKQRRQRIERRIEWTDNYILTNMQANNITEISCPYFLIKPRKNPPAVHIINADELPEEYLTTVITQKINKKEIKEAIKAGEVIPGAELIQGWRLDIK